VVEERELVGRNDCGLADGNDLDGRDCHVGDLDVVSSRAKTACAQVFAIQEYISGGWPLASKFARFQVDIRA
jgi:hypothetical protein